MSNIKINELTEASTITNDDFTIIDDGTNTKKFKALNFGQVNDVQIGGTSIVQNKIANIISGTNVKTINSSSILSSGNLDLEIPSYTTLSVSTDEWNTSTLESETVYTKELTLTGGTSGKHPIVSLAITKPSTMDAENEMFAQIIKVEEGNDTLTITSSAIPTTAYTLQVKNY